MSQTTDQQLLRDYLENRSEAAFSELVRRHIDFVHSAAVRMVRDAHLAEDVAQAAFVALAKRARLVAELPTLEGWLHGTTRNLAANAVRAEVRRRNREKEAVLINETLSTGAGVEWEQISPHLDMAVGQLSESERDALLLRYFKNQDFRRMGATLGISDGAAQKRVSRAVERLREILLKMGVSVATGGLVVVIPANVARAAPSGLAGAISSTVIAGATSQASGLVALLTKHLTMTTIQKTAITATMALLAAVGMHEARQAARLGEQVATLQQQQALREERAQRLEAGLAEATNQLARALAENSTARGGGNQLELVRLRGEVSRWRTEFERLASRPTDATATAAASWSERVARLRTKLKQTPNASIPELRLLTENAWLQVAKDVDFSKEEKTLDSYHYALTKLRHEAKAALAPILAGALREHARQNGDRAPSTIEDLQPHLSPPLDEAILQRYEITQTGTLDWNKSAISEKSPVSDLDELFQFGASGYWFQSVATGGSSGFASLPTNNPPPFPH